MPQNAPEKKLSKTQVKAVELLVEDELTVEEIADRLNIDRKTLFRWRALPHFAALVSETVEAAKQAARQKTIANKLVRVDALIDRHARMQQVIDERADWYKENMPNVPGGSTGLLVNGIKFVKVYEVDAKRKAAKASRWIPKKGDKVEVLDEGLANLRKLQPQQPPNHHGIIDEIWQDGSLLILFDDTRQAAPYPRHLVQPRTEEDDNVIYPTREVWPVNEHAVDTALLKEMRATEQQLAIEQGEWTEKRQTTGASVSLDLDKLNDEQLNEFERLIDTGMEPERAYVRARQSKA